MKKVFTIFICDSEGNLHRNAILNHELGKEDFLKRMKKFYEGKIATILVNGEFSETIRL